MEIPVGTSIRTIAARIPPRFWHLVFMTEVNVADARGVSVRRSCARCGSAFPTVRREYTCPACREPNRHRTHASRHTLSFREQQIVALVGEAKANKEIAYTLCLTEGTVKEYLYRIFRKLNVANRTELALRSFRDARTALAHESPDPFNAPHGFPSGRPLLHPLLSDNDLRKQPVLTHSGK
jgi:DNA-binding CsgD family transcriptional regulator